jgi:Flp pilus assembly protein TadG
MNDTVMGSSEQMAGRAIRSAAATSRTFMERVRARRGDAESGQALVEFAYVAPVLLVVTFGLCLFGIGFNKYLTLNNAVEIGGQLLSQERGETGGTGEPADPCTAASTAAENAAPNLSLASSATWTYNINGNSSTGTSCSSGQAEMGQGGGYAIMTVSIPISFYVPFMGSQSFTLTSSVQEVIQ